jgi:glycosyltransferase involved in cell wall biosynthesis
MADSNIKYQISNISNPKVAIVHDWLVGGGAELVVEQLHRMYPNAPIYTSYATQEWRDRLDGKVKTSWLQYLGKIRKYIPYLRILWFTNLRLNNYDLIISSSGAEAKGIKVPKGTKHINYCHAPTHYYWSRYDEYMKHPGFGIFDPLARLGLWLLVKPLRKWDYKAAQRPDYIIANSLHILKEVKKYYGRESTVINPPVYMDRFTKPENRNQARHGYLIAGRQTPYKRFDLAVAACTKLNLPLTVIGRGPDHKKLRDIAGKTVTFLGHARADVVEQEFAKAKAFLFPGLDDFGITPVEAMASGTPVIAYKAGGALDYVEPGVTGEFFSEQTIESLAQVLKSFNAKKYNSTLIRSKAQKFSKERFKTEFQTYIKSITRQT